MKHWQLRLSVGVFITLVVVVIGSTGQAVAAQPTSCSGWNIVPVPIVGTGASFLNGVTAFSERDVWTVGSYTNSSGYAQTLTMRWNGTKWKIFASPNASSYDNYFQALARVPGTTQMWAVGYDDGSGPNSMQTLTEQWNGTNWAVVASPNSGTEDNSLFSVAAVSSSSAWAVGDYYDTSLQTDQPLIEDWNGSNWSIASTPSPVPSYSFLESVTAVSASDVWAVGYSASFNGALIEHWDGTSWSIITGPSEYLDTIATVDANNIWAMGVGSTEPFAAHWNGKLWKTVPVATPGTIDNYLSSLAVLTKSNIWAVGQYSSSSGVSLTLTQLWNGSSWNAVASPNVSGSNNNNLVSVARVPRTTHVWSIGTYVNTSGVPQPLAEFYC